jgi:SAM-dependent methyltransferase
MDEEKMGLHGPEFYDDPEVFATYRARRETRVDSPNDVLEKPIFDELAGDLAGLRILDLGCGAAGFGREAYEKGCRSYLGIDGSEKMVRLARDVLAETPGQVVRARIETWDYPPHQFDLVASRLALHYIEDVQAVFTKVFRTLVAGGRFVFSVEHPVITSCDRAWRAGGPRQQWIVDDYFETGPRVTSWMGGTVIKVHRTIEDYFCALCRAGFVVNAVRESRPRRALFADQATYERRKRIPLMLFFAGLVPTG